MTDGSQRQKSQPSQKEGVKHRDTLGMGCYECKSKLNISCQANSGTGKHTHSISIWLEHHKRHITYYDGTLPSEVSEMIQENLEWTCPYEIAKKVQIDYPAVSATQIYTVCELVSTCMSNRETKSEVERIEEKCRPRARANVETAEPRTSSIECVTQSPE